MKVYVVCHSDESGFDCFETCATRAIAAQYLAKRRAGDRGCEDGYFIYEAKVLEHGPDGGPLFWLPAPPPPPEPGTKAQGSVTVERAYE